MESKWKERVFQDSIEERVYSSRLLGSEDTLVLHGGGNTSVKVSEKDHTGRIVEVLRVKGSGSDLATIERSGFTGLRLEDLRTAAQIEEMSDEQMVSYLKKSMLDPSEASPSVESFLHAFIPEKFVDHSHSDAILALTNSGKSGDEIASIIGNVIVLPYIPPGFKLAKAVLAVIPDISETTRGIILEKHGLFTFGKTAKESYENHIAIVSSAEKYLREFEGRIMAKKFERVEIDQQTWLPRIRGALSRRRKKLLLIGRNQTALKISQSEEALLFQKAGPATPDMLIRTKYDYLYCDNIDNILKEIDAFAENYATEYGKYVKGFPMHDPYPSIIVIRGWGIITSGISQKEASIVMDQFTHSMKVNSLARAIGKHEFITRQEAYDMEYWPLEEAKLKKTVYRSLQGSVSVVTGAASGIGLEATIKLSQNGSVVVACDIDPDLKQIVNNMEPQIRANIYPVNVDISSEKEVSSLYRDIVSMYGGVDVLFNNAGVLRTAPIDETTVEDVELSFRVNSMGVFLMTREAFIIMKSQKTGGNIVFNITKNLTHPGVGMLSYGSSKAFSAQICHYVAKEGGPYGIRANIINPDKIFKGSKIWANGVLEKRAQAKKQTVDEYKRSNLLRVEVLPEHVANVLISLLNDEIFGATTDAMIPVDGGVI
jgi:rhamnose utilization protein RhaD (predicted bifunctional aldolase and dehydrogenase)/NAD(P)-dependent dehydrogenase (short-subunit alcohol dehydrogenase family)